MEENERGNTQGIAHVKKAFIDSNVPMYWAGSENVFKDACGEILKAAAQEEFISITSVEVFQEILHRFWYLKDMGKGKRIFDYFATIVSEILPIVDEDVYLARSISDRYSCSPRDLLHIAVMQNNNIHVIISADKCFEQVDDIERVDPLYFNSWLNKK